MPLAQHERLYGHAGESFTLCDVNVPKRLIWELLRVFHPRPPAISTAETVWMFGLTLTLVYKALADGPSLATIYAVCCHTDGDISQFHPHSRSHGRGQRHLVPAATQQYFASGDAVLRYSWRHYTTLGMVCRPLSSLGPCSPRHEFTRSVLARPTLWRVAARTRQCFVQRTLHPCLYWWPPTLGCQRGKTRCATRNRTCSARGHGNPSRGVLTESQRGDEHSNRLGTPQFPK